MTEADDRATAFADSFPPPPQQSSKLQLESLLIRDQRRFPVVVQHVELSPGDGNHVSLGVVRRSW